MVRPYPAWCLSKCSSRGFRLMKNHRADHTMPLWHLGRDKGEGNTGEGTGGHVRMGRLHTASAPRLGSLKVAPPSRGSLHGDTVTTPSPP
jgi:hypothetical protein